jgi:hypothetical protein
VPDLFPDTMIFSEWPGACCHRDSEKMSKTWRAPLSRGDVGSSSSRLSEADGGGARRPGPWAEAPASPGKGGRAAASLRICAPVSSGPAAGGYCADAGPSSKPEPHVGPDARRREQAGAHSAPGPGA